MAEETTNTNDSGTPAGASEYTDEQLADAFPGQDLGHVRSMLNKAAGIGVPHDPHAGGDNGDTNGTTTQDSQQGAADSDGSGDDSTVQYPDWIPEKFREGTVEQAMQKLADSYAVLERSRGNADDMGGDSGGDTAGAGSDETSGDADTHLDLRDLEAQFVDNGNKITEEMYKSAEAAGMDRAVLDQFMAGQMAIANQLVTKVHSMVGGPENYDTMLRWMVGNLPEAEVDAYDAAMATGKEGTISMAVRSLKAAYEAAVGTSATVRVEGTTGKPQAQGFQSKREMIDAMKDPRYSKDPAYREDVARRIQNGNVW